MAEEFELGADVIVIPFIFVPHGDPLPTAWLRDHPDYIRLPATFVPRGNGDWSLAVDPAEPPIATGGEAAGWVGALGGLFGIPSAQAQTPRGVPAVPPRSPAEAARLLRFEAAVTRLRRLEPDNRALSFVRDPDSVPGEAWVEELEREVIGAMAREPARSMPPTAAPERSGLSVRDLVMPGGTPIGRRAKGAGEEISTVTRGEYEALVAKLMAMKPAPVVLPGYRGQWYRLPDGTGFGLRRSPDSGHTIDFDNPALLRGFKVHVQ